MDQTSVFVGPYPITTMTILDQDALHFTAIIANRRR